MSSFRRTALVLLLGAVAACGFAPVNAPGGAGFALRDQIEVAAPQDRSSFLLVQRLEERLGRAVDPGYTLGYSLDLRAEGLAEDASGDINRFNLVGVADYTLRNATSGEVIGSGRVNSFTGYATSGTTVATLANERNANERLMTILADQIVARLQILQLP